MTFADILGQLYTDAQARYIDALRAGRDTTPIRAQLEAMERQFAGKLLAVIKTRKRDLAA